MKNDGRNPRARGGARTNSVPHLRGDSRSLPCSDHSGGVLAAIDVGTNAARLEVVRILGDGTLQALHQERAPVRTGEGVFTSGMISAAAVNRLLLTLRRFAAVCGRYDARVRAVATSAVREARNREDLLRRAREEAGIELEVISGDEEARLICLGVLADRSVSRSVVIDIGGGSTEVARATGARVVARYSVPVGAVRLTEAFGSRGRITGAQLSSMRRFASQVLRDTVPRLRSPGVAIGTAGTINSLVGVYGQNGRVSLCEVKRVVQELAMQSLAQKRRRFDATRADIILAGAVILEATLARIGSESVIAVQSGLREGMIQEMSESGRTHTNRRPGAQPRPANTLGKRARNAEQC